MTHWPHAQLGHYLWLLAYKYCTRAAHIVVSLLFIIDWCIVHMSTEDDPGLPQHQDGHQDD